MTQLSKRQAQVYKLLKQQWKTLKRQPNLSTLAAELEMHYVTLKEHLRMLEVKGYLRLEPQGSGCAPVITLREPEHLLPLLNEVAVDSLHDGEQKVEGYLKLPARGRFALWVQDDSMAEVLQEGDVVMLEQRSWTNGDVVAVRVKGKTVLRRIYRDRGDWKLEPYNPNYDRLFVSTNNLKVLGTCCGVLRGEFVGLLRKELQRN